ncbi:MAG: D-2-hydroxyacid dehydrogenase [Rhodobacteraceae bacterium]|nr:D-2-hydroxyacid dehydrogenase [Paracoccaceae bacterium]
MKTVLCTVSYRAQLHAQLASALAPAEVLFCDDNDTATIAKALKRADVAILKGDLDQRHLDAPHLKWVHCDHAGLNKSARPEVFEKGLIVTGSVGRAAQALAQHIFYFALGMVYDTPGLEQMKAKRQWRGGVNFTDRRGLIGKTMGIIGLGSTGLATAELAKAFQMRVLAYRKSVTPCPDAVDTLFCADQGDTIDDILAQSDLVVLCIRLTDETCHMIGAPQFAQMKDSAFLINMARGAVVDEAALVDALNSGTIAGAGLDVFEQEPLPSTAPIWGAKNVMITPHATAEVPDLQANSLAIICDNISRYRQEKPMRNQLNLQDVYTK